MESKLKILTSQREYIFRGMQILFDLSKEIVTDRSKVSVFKARYTRIHIIRDEFIKINEEIQTLQLKINPEQNVDQLAISAFDDLYYTVISTASEFSQKPERCGSGGVIVTDSVSRTDSGWFVNARLPKLELPRFDSNIENWQTFYDTFKTLIHENNSISSIEKFHYLISCLSGPALYLVKGVPVTSDNYEIVFNALIERYQNKRILAITYLDKILNYPVVKTSNFKNLQALANIFYESNQALKTLNIENLGEFILFYLASRALDADTRNRFESQNVLQIPTFTALLKFLQDYVKVLETSQLSSANLNPARTFDGKKPTTINQPSSSGSKRSSYLTKSSPQTFLKCVCCGDAHSIYKCPTFQSLNSNARQSLIDNKKLCKNCLRSNHVTNQCKSQVNCLQCGAHHHTLLHTEQAQINTGTVSQASTSVQVGRSRGLILLGTCQVRVCNTIAGTEHTVRALLDSGAQDCFITTACARKIGLQLRRCNLTVAGIGQNTVFQVKGETNCVLRPLNNDHPQFTIKPIVLDNITSRMPSTKLPSIVRERYKHLTLADSYFDCPGEIDLLIGAEVFHEVYDGQRIQLGPGLPAALHSVFGWVLTGVLETDTSQRPPITASFLAETCTLEDQVKQFWEIEEPPRVPLRVPEDELCEQLYTELTYRNPDGRYVVPILLKPGNSNLGESYTRCLSRLINMEKKLTKQNSVKVDYINFMREYENLNHMYPVSQSTLQRDNRYLIPHHCVINPESTTTKLRVVFDGSCKTTNGLSLNDIVFTGPKLQVDIIDIITSFRLHAVVFTCDIAKMYRQILIRPEDRPYQHILWRESPSDPVREYELSTITYGVSSSPYLAIRTLHQLAADYSNEYPRAAEALRHETFMDDITTGAPSVQEAIELKDQLIKLLGFAQLELRKWSSNSELFLQTLPADHCQSPKPFSDAHYISTLKILGVQYDPMGDNFTYSYRPIVDKEHTKRSILSNVARIFDPLGWITPVILKAKLLLQDLWRLNLSWDESVPRDISDNWREFIRDLNHLPYIQIPRHAVTSNAIEFQLVGFCDGSTKAYGCSVYLRSITSDRVQAHLLIAKSKVAPLKVLTVNRLELCGAVLLAKVVNSIYTALSKNIHIAQTILFTDSSTVLSWINTEPHKLKTFVAHRVMRITNITLQFVWRHVSTRDNPADLCSRGMSCFQLVNCESWWSGPPWLIHKQTDWPVSAIEKQEYIPELKSLSHISHGSTETTIIDFQLESTSNISHAQRVIAWVYRFIRNAKLNRSNRNLSPFLISSELDQSMSLLVKHVQRLHFQDILLLIQSNKILPKHISKLSPFFDSRGVLRVGGRLKQAHLPLNTKHPYLLPKSSRLCILLIDHFHKTYLHCGPRLLQSLIQRQFWILGIRNLIRSRLSKCVTCFKVKPVSVQPVMGDLPLSRLEPGQPFQTVGIDFGGPFMVKESKRRNARIYKAYLCLIVCHSIKAVHLELVTELTTEAFIAALDRFVSRRGLCQAIITDSGTNFVGAKRYLSDVVEMLNRDRSNISNKLASRGITWKMNPASGPHFGGIFESGIKSTKYHLKRIVGSQILTYEELYTVLTKIEAMLNSRPLVELSSDPGEVDALTAGHFLIGRPLVSLPEPVREEKGTLRTRWRLVQRLSQSFWRIWQRDYLHTLQQRTKWFKQGNRQPKLNDLVTIFEPNLPANEWRLGRVVKLHPGNDGIVRVVTVRTSKGLLVRPVVKICPLPIEEHN